MVREPDTFGREKGYADFGDRLVHVDRGWVRSCPGRCRIRRVLGVVDRRARAGRGIAGTPRAAGLGGLDNGAHHCDPDPVCSIGRYAHEHRRRVRLTLEKLFHAEKSFREVTCLLLTHDIEPAIDIHRTSANPVVHFLTGRGVISEIPITPEDIWTFSEVCRQNIDNATDPIIKCIYARRYLEVHGARGSTQIFLTG